MARRTVIELLGVPAAGKSSLAAALADEPGTVVVKDHSRRDLPALVAGTARAWPVLLAGLPPGATRLRWAAWAGRLGAAPSVARHRGSAGSLVVLDQGPAYTLGRMHGLRGDSRGSRWWHGQACATARVLDLLVVLDAPAEVLVERLRSRDKAHAAAGLTPEAARDYLLSERQTCRSVADTVARAGVRVLHLDTGRLSVAEQVQAVRTALRSGHRRLSA